MDIKDLLGNNSSEIKDLLDLIDKIQLNITSQAEKVSISGEYLLDSNEVCQMLHLSSRTLQDYRNKGLIAFYKLEGKILYKLSDIRKMLEENYYDAWKYKR